MQDPIMQHYFSDLFSYCIDKMLMWQDELKYMLSDDITVLGLVAILAIIVLQLMYEESKRRR